MFHQIMGLLIKHRHSCLPRLNQYMNDAKDLWKTYKELNTFHTNVGDLEMALKNKKEEISIEDLPDWTIPAIHIGQLILMWRSAAQAYDRKQIDPVLVEHCRSRTDGNSIKGPLLRPNNDLMPTINKLKIKQEKILKMVEQAADILDSTGCNWADFMNKNSLVMKYVRFTLFSMALRQTYKHGAMASPDTRTIFEEILITISEHLSPDMEARLELPKPKKGKKRADNTSKVHAGMAFTELEALDNELRQGLQQLTVLVKKYGTVCGSMPEKVSEAYTKLILVRRQTVHLTAEFTNLIPKGDEMLAAEVDV